MNDSSGNKKGGWLRYGCFGCLGILGFVVIAVVGLIGVAMMQVRSEEIEEKTATPDIPALAVLPEGAAPPAESPATPPAADTIDEPPVVDPTPGSGRVVLDLAQGAFEIMPGRPGDRLEVEATYDKKSYVLEEALEIVENPAEGQPGWTYTVRFRRTGGSGLVAMFKGLLGASTPRVRVVLPPDTPLLLDGRISQGEARVDLGGLWITEADLHFTQGGIELEVSEPLRQPMDSLTMDGSMGGMMVSRLGNASPRRLDVDFSMGGLVLDLRGEWAADADIDINASMGGTVVRLPRDVAIEGVPGHTGREFSPTDELRPPVLRFRTTSSMGEIEFQD